MSQSYSWSLSSVPPVENGLGVAYYGIMSHGGPSAFQTLTSSGSISQISQARDGRQFSDVKKGQLWLVLRWKITKEAKDCSSEADNDEPPLHISCFENPMGWP